VLILIGRDLKTCEVSIYSDAFDNSEQISLSKETCRGQKVLGVAFVFGSDKQDILPKSITRREVAEAACFAA
jgi:hypothetical protein